MKVCSRCRDERPLADYCRSSGTPDGLHRWCAACRRAAKRSTRERRIDYYRAQNLEWSRAHPERMAAARARRSAQHLAAKAARPRSCHWCRRTIPPTMRAHAKFCRPSCRAANQSLRRVNGGVRRPHYLTRLEIYVRDGGICHLCRTWVPWAAYHVDHIIPVAHGGTSHRANVAVSHARCNRRKGAQLPADHEPLVQSPNR